MEGYTLNPKAHVKKKNTGRYVKKLFRLKITSSKFRFDMPCLYSWSHYTKIKIILSILSHTYTCISWSGICVSIPVPDVIPETSSLSLLIVSDNKLPL